MAASAFLSANHWLLAFPMDVGSSAAVLGPVRTAIAEQGGAAVADLAEFPIPPMKVGTFEGLLGLSDELGRADTYCEGVVRKAERQVAESYLATKAAELAARPRAAGAASPAAGQIPALLLSVNGTPVGDWVKKWAWDVEAWDPRDPLPDLVRRLVGAAEKADSDLRSYTSAYSEKRQALTQLERKRGGNLMVAGLEDVLTPDALQAAGAEFAPADSEYLQTHVFVVAKGPVEEAFLAGYEALAPAAVPFGPEGRRDASHGSPVVPGSARRVAADKDGYVVYTVTALKKYGDALRAAAKERRWAVRDFAYSAAAAGSGARAAAELEVAVAAALAQLREQSLRKYGEGVALWMHLKAVRLFVEAVLKYGLPAAYAPGTARAPFAGAVVACARGKQKLALAALTVAWRSIGSGNPRLLLEDAFGAAAGKGGKGTALDPVIPGVSDASASGTSALPFVLADFDLRMDTTAAVSTAR